MTRWRQEEQQLPTVTSDKYTRSVKASQNEFKGREDGSAEKMPAM